MLIFRRLMLVVVLGFNVVIANTSTRQPQPAQAQSANGLEPSVLKVGVVGNPPFTIFGATPPAEITGISLDVWRGVADSQNWRSEYVPLKSISQGIQAVVDRKLDVLIGPISITPERAAIEGITFTQPYFMSSALKKTINVQLLNLIYSRKIAEFTERWLGVDIEQVLDPYEPSP